MVSQCKRLLSGVTTAWRYRHNAGTKDGSIIAIIITTHMRRNDAAAPGIGISPIADMDPHHAVVSAALAAKSSA